MVYLLNAIQYMYIIVAVSKSDFKQWNSKNSFLVMVYLLLKSYVAESQLPGNVIWLHSKTEFWHASHHVERKCFTPAAIQ